MNQFIMHLNPKQSKEIYADVIIVGAGIAGLYTALMLPRHLQIVILSKDSWKICNSYLAQGGIAAAIHPFEDSPRQHFEDTMKCSRYSSDPQAVKILVEEASENIENLMKLGISFDKKQNGEWMLGREGAHTVNRILHAGGDQTGARIMEALIERVDECPNIRRLEDCFVIDIIHRAGKCMGILADLRGERRIFRSPRTVLATGGIGRIYGRTTNAEGILGDGIAMAVRAGIRIKDMDAVQFHPTAFYEKENPGGNAFLISEAVRGEGAILYNEAGVRFMDTVHPLKELAPRDVVARAIFQQLQQQQKPYVYLDICHRSKKELESRFPSIFAYCLERNMDISSEPIPVQPAAHYFMGGIAVDLWGQTSMKHLYACGECACTGVHGKNRLASNSLLEAIVFGKRIATHIQNNPGNTGRALPKNYKKPEAKGTLGSTNNLLEDIQQGMLQYVGIERNQEGLLRMQKKITVFLCEAAICSKTYEIETVNALLVAQEIVRQAINNLNREEEKLQYVQSISYGSSDRDGTYGRHE